MQKYTRGACADEQTNAHVCENYTIAKYELTFLYASEMNVAAKKRPQLRHDRALFPPSLGHPAPHARGMGFGTCNVGHLGFGGPGQLVSEDLDGRGARRRIPPIATCGRRRLCPSLASGKYCFGSGVAAPGFRRKQVSAEAGRAKAAQSLTSGIASPGFRRKQVSAEAGRAKAAQSLTWLWSSCSWVSSKAGFC